MGLVCAHNPRYVKLERQRDGPPRGVGLYPVVDT